jgi:enoyl-CoA hydratase/carnithine racemase
LYSPADAVTVGLLDETVEDAPGAVDRAAAIARQLGTSLPEFAAMKRNLVRPIVRAWEASRDELDTAFLDSWFAEPAQKTRAETVARLQRRD